MKYYLKDRETGQIEYKNSLKEVIYGLESYVQHKFNKTRKQFMEEIISLNYGVYDDEFGKYFAEHLKKFVEMGVSVNKNGKEVLRECDIHECDRNLKYRTELGD